MASVTWQDLGELLLSKEVDFELASTWLKQLHYQEELRWVIHKNLLDVLKGTAKEFVFRVYYREPEGWEFYGYSVLRGSQLVSLGNDARALVENRTSQAIDICQEIGTEKCLVRHEKSDNHLVTAAGIRRYLLHSKYPEVVTAALRYFRGN